MRLVRVGLGGWPPLFNIGPDPELFRTEETWKEITGEIWRKVSTQIEEQLLVIKIELHTA